MKKNFAVSEKIENAKKNAVKVAKYVGVAASGALLGAGIMYAATHGNLDKVASVASSVADQATDIVPEVVEATI